MGKRWNDKKLFRNLISWNVKNQKNSLIRTEVNFIELEDHTELKQIWEMSTDKSFTISEPQFPKPGITTVYASYTSYKE